MFLLQASGGRGLSPAEYESKRGEFEAWLLVQNQRLSGLLSTQGAALGPKETMIRRDELQVRAAHSVFLSEMFIS